MIKRVVVATSIKGMKAMDCKLSVENCNEVHF